MSSVSSNISVSPLSSLCHSLHVSLLSLSFTFTRSLQCCAFPQIDTVLEFERNWNSLDLFLPCFALTFSVVESTDKRCVVCRYYADNYCICRSCWISVTRRLRHCHHLHRRSQVLLICLLTLILIISQGGSRAVRWVRTNTPQRQRIFFEAVLVGRGAEFGGFLGF